MKRTTFYSTIAAFGVAIGASAEQVRFSELPASVQKAINRNLNGGIVQEVDRKTDGGRTFYHVEIRREGKNKHIRVDADGKRLPRDTRFFDNDAGVDVDVETDRDVFDKNDGKILGVIDDPDADFEAEGRLDDDSLKVETNIDKPADRGVTEDIFDKNDGKILDVLPAPSRDNAGASAEVEVDTGRDVDADFDADVDLEADKDLDLDADANLEANKGKGKGIFRKGDGKILGIPFPWLEKDEVKVEVDRDNRDEITTDADGGLDTDKGDNRILGVPKRGFETLGLNEVPPVVRETIRREAGGYKVAEIERATLEGRGVYEVDIEREGANRELHIAADGTILKDSDREAIGAPARNEAGQSKGN